jgi:deoxyribodipyrimidine photolyase-related protein
LKKLVLVLGDQLKADSSAFNDFRPATDHVIMIESELEASHVWSHKARIALFLSAMRHFAEDLRGKRYQLTYIAKSKQSIIAELKQHIQKNQYSHLVCVEPGEWRLKLDLENLAHELKIHLDIRKDDHFYCQIDEFKNWAGDKKELRLEYFYRYMRKKHQVLMQKNGEPEGDQWNFDDQNRGAYSKKGPGLIVEPVWFEPDAITKEAIADVNERYGDHPGSLENFAWPVTRKQALIALEHFMEHRLPNFGLYQDAMWTNTPFGWHSILSASLNLKLIHPKEVVDAAVDAWKRKNISINAVEGFVRQILGWREFVRGMYYLDMPKMAEQNFYGHQQKLPQWYWTGSTKMACMKDAIDQTMKFGYAHHIQRLMVTGNFALLAEILPKDVCDWYLAVYVDAIEWVELPNTAGMALFANGPRFTSKPYIASGAYIKRMSNYCDGCSYKPSERYGDGACPMTNLYWNFLIKHKAELEKNPRTRLMTANLNKIDESEQEKIRRHAKKLLNNLENI